MDPFFAPEDSLYGLRDHVIDLWVISGQRPAILALLCFHVSANRNSDDKDTPFKTEEYRISIT